MHAQLLEVWEDATTGRAKMNLDLPSISARRPPLVSSLSPSEGAREPTARVMGFWSPMCESSDRIDRTLYLAAVMVPGVPVDEHNGRLWRWF